MQVRGWSTDPNVRTRPVTIHVYIGGRAGTPGAEGHNIGTTKTYRPDVNRVYPGDGDYHGYDTVINTNKTGTQEVCAYGLNVGPGGNTLLGCKNVTISSTGFVAGSGTGLPTNSVHAWAHCQAQDFDGGAWGWFVRAGVSSASYTVRHGMLEGYLRHGRGAEGPLGCPTSDEYATSGGVVRQNFEFGTLEWRPGYPYAVALGVRNATPDECIPGGEQSFSSQVSMARAMDCLTQGGANLVEGAADATGQKLVSIAAYTRQDGTYVVSHTRWQRGLGELTEHVPAQDARYISTATKRAFVLVGAGLTFHEEWQVSQGQSWQPVRATLKTAAELGGGAAGGWAAASVVGATTCGALTAGLCVIAGGVVIAVGSLAGAWLGGKAGDLFIELAFE